jgi:putative ABC transport system substrate-binding protein
VAVLRNAANLAKRVDWKTTQEAGAALRLAVDSREVRGPDDFPAAFGAIRSARPDALLILEDPLTFAHRAAIVEFAARERLPACYGLRGLANDSSLMSLGIDPTESCRRGASYSDRTLKGAKPADLPVQQPTKFELVINLTAARALPIKFPPSILSRADAVIE